MRLLFRIRKRPESEAPFMDDTFSINLEAIYSLVFINVSVRIKKPELISSRTDEKMANFETTG